MSVEPEVRSTPTATRTRRRQILDTAADLFATRGFHGVSVADLGAACGISGPALYKHFRSKDDLLAEMLVSISEELLDVGRRRAEEADGPAAALADLVAWHVDFALAHRALIVVQDRDWGALPPPARERVRALQRAYVELWARQMRALPDGPWQALKPSAVRAGAQAVFGLINSTPRAGRPGDDVLRALLVDAASRALGIPGPVSA